MCLGACRLPAWVTSRRHSGAKAAGAGAIPQWQAPRGQTGSAQEPRSPGAQESGNPGAQEESQWPLEGLRQSSVWPSVPAREHPAVALLAAGDQPRVRWRSIA